MRQLFSSLPADTGMAFVVIQHLDPARPSMLAKVLGTDVAMPVLEVTADVRPECDHVYVIPAGFDLSMQGGLLTRVPRQQTRNLHLPIDSFFQALASEWEGQAIGVVLSGSASDGTEGLRAIKAAGGITFAQEPGSAQFTSMPESAIAAGVVDFQLSPAEIASELVHLSRHQYLAPAQRIEGSPDANEDANEDAPAPDEASVAIILAALLQHAEVDFRGYKRPTLIRRIVRRMALRHLASLDEYAASVRKDPEEAQALARDVLIHVTSFFRDPEVFEALTHTVLLEVLTARDESEPIRVWIPGCSTGQEAYSIAICLVEVLAEHGRSPSIKIFGSDLSDQAIEAARAGLYTDSDLAGVSSERLARFFERAEGGYRISKQIRDSCVFVRHDLTRDPPFAKLDLISCRNVLIYFDSELQRRVLPLLHHCLNTPGYLVLGNSEGLRELDGLFEAVDREHRIFRKQGESPRLQYPLAFGREAESKIPVFQAPQWPQHARDAQRQADHLLLARYAPPGVIVNDRHEVVQVRGRTGDFLELPPGQPQVNILKMARNGLTAPLREALAAARAESTTIRRPGVRIEVNGTRRSINLEVTPLAGVRKVTEHYYLIVFEELTPPSTLAADAPPAAPEAPHAQDEENTRLRAELAANRDYVQAVAGEHQDTVEELGAANEEFIAANEELQSTNEELQSAKEELQSTNEELNTLNDELQLRNIELDRIANDLVNVLESVQIPVIMVDHALRVRRFTPISREISGLLPGDVGRSIDDVKLKVRVDDLTERIRASISANAPKEHEVQRVDGRWFMLHIRPYRTSDNRLDGAVLAFLDIDVLKRAAQEAERARDYAQSIVETVPMSLVVLDSTLRIVSANPPFYRSCAPDLGPKVQVDFFGLQACAFDVPDFREAVERSLARRLPFRDLEVRCTLANFGARELVVSGCPIPGDTGELMLLLAIEDATERHQLEASEKSARVDAETANRAKDLFLATLSHELRTPLSTILMSAELLQMEATVSPKIRRASAAIERAVSTQAKLIDDLLDISRIVSGKLMLDLEAVDFTSVVQAAVDVAEVHASAKGVTIELAIRGAFRPIHGDASRLQQVVANLLTNAIKFTPSGGHIEVLLESRGETAQLTVSDTGIGLRADMIPHLFDRFVQAESAMTRAHGGLGLGLAIVRHLVDVHGGEVRAESRGDGHGSTFIVTLPLSSREPAVPEPRPTVSRSISGIHVLLVEDDDDTREACAAMLEAQGADVRAVSSVAQGLAALEMFMPQVILCDIAMPGEDGYAFIHQLRTGRRGGQIPAAALTALAGEEDRRHALAAGFQMHLSKPIDAAQLAAAVASLHEWSEPIRVAELAE